MSRTSRFQFEVHAQRNTGWKHRQAVIAQRVAATPAETSARSPLLAAWCSLGRKGTCWDNPVAERFFATINGELIDRRTWPTVAGARVARCSTGSRAGTTPAGFTHRSATSAQPNTKTASTKTPATTRHNQLNQTVRQSALTPVDADFIKTLF